MDRSPASSQETCIISNELPANEGDENRRRSQVLVVHSGNPTAKEAEVGDYTHKASLDNSVRHTLKIKAGEGALQWGSPGFDLQDWRMGGERKEEQTGANLRGVHTGMCVSQAQEWHTQDKETYNLVA